METTREQKHHHRERRPMMHSANERAPHFFFFVMCSSVCQYTFLSHSFFFVRVAYTARPKTKETRDLSLPLSLLFLHIYATKVITKLFFSRRTISLTAKVYNKQRMASKKQEKKRIRFYV
jgi:hypothetical protein